jgi:thiol-disulfide isomerase/thioredoxin
VQYSKFKISHDVIIIDIYGDRCDPCKVLLPKLEEYSSPNILFCKIKSEGLPTIEFRKEIISKNNYNIYL